MFISQTWDQIHSSVFKYKYIPLAWNKYFYQAVFNYNYKYLTEYFKYILNTFSIY